MGAISHNKADTEMAVAQTVVLPAAGSFIFCGRANTPSVLDYFPWRQIATSSEAFRRSARPAVTSMMPPASPPLLSTSAKFDRRRRQEGLDARPARPGCCTTTLRRLRHRQFSVLVTTSHLDRHAYKDIREDGHPVVVLAGRDITDILKRSGFNSVVALRRHLHDNYSPR